MRSNISPEKLIANRNNAKLSTGPKTKKGKAKVAKNALSHGLNAQIQYEDNPHFKLFYPLLIDSGYEKADAYQVAVALTEYRRVMDAYHDTYNNVPDIGFMYSISPAFIAEFVMEQANKAPGKVTNTEINKVSKILDNERDKEQQKGSIEMRRSSDLKRFIRYQRKAAAKVGKALCQSNKTKPK